MIQMVINIEELAKARRPTHREAEAAGQLGLFGMRSPAKKHDVKAHVRHGKHGTTLVMQHQRIGGGAKAKRKPEAKPEPEEPLTVAEVFRLGGKDLVEHATRGDLIAQAELQRRNEKRASKGKAPIPGSPDPAAASAPAPEPAPIPEPEPEIKSARERAMGAMGVERHRQLEEDGWKFVDGDIAETDPTHGLTSNQVDRLSALGVTLMREAHDFERPGWSEHGGGHSRAWGELGADGSGRGRIDVAGDGYAWQYGAPWRTSDTGNTETLEEAAIAVEAARAEHEGELQEEEPEPLPTPEPEPKPEVDVPGPEVREDGRTKLVLGPQSAEVPQEMRGQGEHSDVGEVLWGARKHRWKAKDGVNVDNLLDVEGLGGDTALKYVNKKHVVGKHDPEHDRELGATAGGSYLKKKLIAAIATTPAGDNPVVRRSFVHGWDWLAHELDGVHTTDDVFAFLEDWRHKVEGRMLQEEHFSGRDMLAKFGLDNDGSRGYRPNASRVDLRTTAERKEFRDLNSRRTMSLMTPDKFPPLEPHEVARHNELDNMEGWLSHAKMTAAGYDWKLHHTDAGYQMFKPLPKEENPYRMYAFALAGLNPDDPNMARSARSNRLVRVLQRSSKSGYWKSGGDWSKARAYEKGDDWTWSGKAATAKKRGKRWTRATTGQRRVGGPNVQESVNGADLMEQYGFAGVQHGNWVNQEHRQYHMDRAMESFADLADIMGVDPKMIAHGGRLGIAFGARGGGNASAHYESGMSSGRPVINLTHTSGAGSLAHEWAHFFDHQITEDPSAFIIEQRGGRSGKRSPFVSHGEGAGALHPEVNEAFRNVMQAIHYTSDPKTVIGDAADLKARQTDVEQRIREHNRLMRFPIGHEAGYADHATYDSSRKAVAGDRTALNRDWKVHYRSKANTAGDRKSDYARHAGHLGGYWERPHELFARAFESWVEDHLESKGRLNTYLVSGTQVKYEIARSKAPELLEPYPQGKDRTRINAAMLKLSAAMSKHNVLSKALEAFEVRPLPRVARAIARMRLFIRGS